MPRSSRTALILAAATVLVTLGVAAPANAAPSPKSNAPAASATAGTPDGDAVSIDYAINRGSQAIASQACDVDGTPVACDDAADTTTKKASTWSVDLDGLAVGEHTFTVTFTLTGGGSAAASAGFTIDGPTLEEACASLTGTLIAAPPGFVWACGAVPYTGGLTGVDAILTAGIAALGPFCPSGNFVGSYAYSEAGQYYGYWYCSL
ncbi:hypothetical protein [Agromyces sp. ZXT2-3]|uniref:hypothetical protein n=1 Tax=Agromyces sp. ZXT2-3 TaxID=3461152 RepID=UPI004054F14C